MASQLPSELREVLQRSINTAKVFQTQINNLNGTVTEDKDLLNLLVQAHTQHLLNHSTLVRHVTSSYTSENPALQSIAGAGEQMIKDARQLQEYIVGLQVTKERGANRPTTPAPKVRDYRAPTVEPSEDDEDAEAEDIPAAPNGRKSKAHWNKQEGDKSIPVAEESALRSSPKRHLSEIDGLPSQAMVKRTKLSLAPSTTDAPPPKESKRKSDVSMIDAEDVDEPISPPPVSKRQKKQHESTQEQEQVPPVRIEYEDITAEVDARMKQTEERKMREKKQEMGVVDKRKRMSGDSFEVELARPEPGDVEKPVRKRKKARHATDD